jgi:hypothetical protein
MTSHITNLAVARRCGLRSKHFAYRRRLARMLRAYAPLLLPPLLMEMRAELAVRRKLFPKPKV